MTKYFEIDSPALKHAGEYAADFKLKNHGLTDLDRVYWNLPTPALYEESIFRVEAHIAHQGPLVVNTGKWSARAAQDKFVVKEHSTADRIWWGEYNRPFEPEKFSNLRARVASYWQGEELFVQDCYAG
ncbi:MAG: phosphoenolpyruvate carboxykinase (ATP), partial [Proteobacteria bacterium]|nr:phosphoenolpyruvate carboxykinase (ATP) [Pseudomonadota bacterium]